MASHSDNGAPKKTLDLDVSIRVFLLFLFISLPLILNDSECLLLTGVPQLVWIMPFFLLQNNIDKIDRRFSKQGCHHPIGKL